MKGESQLFIEMSEQIGGFTEEGVQSIFFVKSPFDLHHWTMNVIEVLLVAGAVWGLVHAIKQAKNHGNVLNLGVWIAAVVYMLVIEIPLYFPEKIGGDPNNVMFMHNEFTVNFFYNRAPLYIIALYPALSYPAYVLIAQSGIFDRRWGVVLGAVATGFVHHLFYEIFDHFGPQYGWWIWNYETFVGTLAAVPVSSLYGFAFVGPIGLVLSVYLTLGRYVKRRTSQQLPVTATGFTAWTVAAGVLTPIMLVFLNGQQMLIPMLGIEYTPQVEAVYCFTVLALVALLTVYLSLTSNPHSGDRYNFAFQYFGLYLLTFAGLWLYAVPDYFAVTDGFTAEGLRVGSLPYALACFAVGSFFVLRSRASARRSPATA